MDTNVSTSYLPLCSTCSILVKAPPCHLVKNDADPCVQFSDHLTRLPPSSSSHALPFFSSLCKIYPGPAAKPTARWWPWWRWMLGPLAKPTPFLFGLSPCDPWLLRLLHLFSGEILYDVSNIKSQCPSPCSLGRWYLFGWCDGRKPDSPCTRRSFHLGRDWHSYAGNLEAMCR